MVILAFESSAGPASVCLLRDGAIAALNWQNIGYTHSQTLMPAADHVLKTAGITADMVDAFAVASGPGSFTGLRIGISTVKGLAWALDKPCFSISTLLGMSYNHLEFEGVLCAAMDARRSQVYTALFSVHQGKVTRLSEDEARDAAELAVLIKKQDMPIMFIGDGAEIAFQAAKKVGVGDIRLAPESTRLQSAVGVALAAQIEGVAVNAAELVPNYLRQSQAEREREKKEAIK